jgi:hypothetical protein
MRLPEIVPEYLSRCVLFWAYDSGDGKELNAAEIEILQE